MSNISNLKLLYCDEKMDDKGHIIYSNLDLHNLYKLKTQTLCNRIGCINIPENEDIYCSTHLKYEVGLSPEMIEIKNNMKRRIIGVEMNEKYTHLVSMNEIQNRSPWIERENKRKRKSKKRVENKELVIIRCHHEGCTNEAKYFTPDLLPSMIDDYSGIFQKKIRTHCKVHKTKGMRYYRSKICCICGKFGSFVSPLNRSLLFCKIHRREGMESCAYDKCLRCDVKGSYVDNFKDYFCKTHSTPDMKCRWKCRFPYCNIDASYGYNYKSAEYCYIHKLEYMKEKKVNRYSIE